MQFSGRNNGRTDRFSFLLARNGSTKMREGVSLANVPICTLKIIIIMFIYLKIDCLRSERIFINTGLVILKSCAKHNIETQDINKSNSIV